MKTLLQALLILFFYTPTTFAYVILLDPGHGGEELGAIAKVRKKEIYEKDLTLLLSKKVKEYLPNHVTSYLTRSFDRTVSLGERAKMADTVKADLFISIHFNSAEDKKAHGFEIYYLDNHDDAAVKKVEQIENKDIDGSEAIINQILIDLVIDRTATTSKVLANKILQKVDGGVGRAFKRKNRGIRPGLFYVLALSKRPGVLVEVGFMSNQEELSIMQQDKFLEKYARAIANGIVDYIKTLPPKNLVLF